MSADRHYEWIAPEQAKEILARGSFNREQKQAQVQMLKREVERGAWNPAYSATAIELYNQDGSIGIGPTTICEVGGHRLAMTVEVGRPVLHWVHWRTERMTEAELLGSDSIEPLTLAQGLTMLNKRNPGLYPFPKYHQAHYRTSRTWGGTQFYVKPSLGEMVEWVSQNKNYKEAAAFAKKNDSGDSVVRIPIGVMATLWDIACYGEGPALIEEFVSQVRRGGVGSEDHPTRRLVARYARHDYHNREFPALIARAVAALQRHEKLNKLYYKQDSPTMLFGYWEWVEANGGTGQPRG